MDRSRRVAELIVRDELRVAPDTSLNVPIGQTRRYAVVRAPLDELNAVSHYLGGSITDVVLAAATGGLRELLLSREEALPSRGLRALVPITRREASHRLTLGNLLSFWFIDLPVGEPRALARLRKIAAATRRRKSSDAARATSTVMEVAALAPPVVAHPLLTHTVFSKRMFNVVVTNVPGAPVPLYAFGALLCGSTRSCRCSPTTRWESSLSPTTGRSRSGSTPTPPQCLTSTCWRAESRRVSRSCTLCCPKPRRSPVRSANRVR